MNYTKINILNIVHKQLTSKLSDIEEKKNKSQYFMNENMSVCCSFVWWIWNYWS